MTDNNKKSSTEGQTEALKALEEKLKSRVGGFTLLGPSGPGKSAVVEELRKLADEFKGSDTQTNSSLIFATSNAAERLLGHPDGYVGFDEGGLLSQKFLDRIQTPIVFAPLSDEAKEKIAELKAKKANERKPGV